MSFERIDGDGQRHDNITDWALKQFTIHYKAAALSSAGTKLMAAKNKAKKITKEAIFHYCYAVLHDPIYRERIASAVFPFARTRALPIRTMNALLYPSASSGSHG